MLNIVLFGKQGCNKCQATKKKLSFFLDKWGYAGDQVRLVYHDLDTIDGRAEGAFQDVGNDIPVIVVEHEGRSIARWESSPPTSKELQLCLESAIGATSN